MSAGCALFCPGQPPAGQGDPTPGPGTPQRLGARGRHGSLARIPDPMIPPPVLQGDSEPIWKISDEIIGESDGPDHLPHQPRRPKGSRGANCGHSVWEAGVHCKETPPAPTRSVPGRKPVLRGKLMKSEKTW